MYTVAAAAAATGYAVAYAPTAAWPSKPAVQHSSSKQPNQRADVFNPNNPAWRHNNVNNANQLNNKEYKGPKK
jgi:hypothetical protein